MDGRGKEGAIGEKEEEERGTAAVLPLCVLLPT